MKYILLKRLFLSLLIFSVGTQLLFCQSTFEISGIVKDKDNEPLIGVNAFIHGTIDGGITNSNGEFKFTTSQKDTVVLIVSYVGFKDYQIKSDVFNLNNLKVTLEQKEVAIDEVVIVASSFNFGQESGKFKKMNSLDIVMTGSSNGDIYAALQSLPGIQKVGENGRLYVRGGESYETQTFINGMHVLVPYTTNAENSVQRSRFSPFLFKGINLTLGGYGAEYGQALSSVLPMQTTDVSAGD
ncbi:MAG: TonB-dependent receptor, partial [Dysgonamonadaceae bacterium]|nr:TonB-dependent receptor [Dysgonamonadaceae bacterium]